MVNPNWQILQPVDVGGQIQKGIALGEQQREKREVRNALAQYATNPEQSINALMQYAPDVALRLRGEQRTERTYQDGQKFNKALSGYYGAQAPALGSPQMGGGTLPPVALSPQSGQLPMGQPSMEQPQAGQAAPEGQPRELSARDKAFQEMLAIDPVKAMKIDSEARNQAVKALEGLDDVYDVAISRLGGATDESSYQAMIADVGERFKAYGYDIRTIAPANYPGPEGIRALLQSALDAKEQLAALDRRDRLEWDQQDDQRDNARADREANNRIETRNRGATNAERRTKIAETRPAPRASKAPKVTATNPATGETITLNSRGQWVDKNGAPVK